MISASSLFKLVDNAQLFAKTDLTEKGLSVDIILTDFVSKEDVIMHWGITVLNQPRAWTAPVHELPAMKHFTWDDSKTKLTTGAAQTTFQRASDNVNDRVVHFLFKGVTTNTPLVELPATLEFVLHCPPDMWVKNGKTNFTIAISSFLQTAFEEKELLDAARVVLMPRLNSTPSNLLAKERWTVKNNNVTFALIGYALCEKEESISVYFFTDTPHPIILHWGFEGPSGQSQWIRPDVTQLLSSDANDGTETDFVSHPWDDRALQSEFQFLNRTGESSLQFLRLILLSSIAPSAIKFVLKELHANTWFKNDGADFILRIPQNPVHLNAREATHNIMWERGALIDTRLSTFHWRWLTLRSIVVDSISGVFQAYKKKEEDRRRAQEKRAEEQAVIWKTCEKLFLQSRDTRKRLATVTSKSVTLSGDVGLVDIIVNFNETTSKVEIHVLACAKRMLILHWGVVGQAGNLRRFGGQEWNCPAKEYRPSGTVVIDPARSCETPFEKAKALPVSGLTDVEKDLCTDFFQEILIQIPAKSGAPGSSTDSGVLPEVGGLACVFRESEGGRWFKSVEETDVLVRLTSPEHGAWQGYHADVAEEILGAEVGWHHMTLMHRCNLINGSVTKWHGDQSKLGTPKRSRVMRTWTSLFRPVIPVRITETPGSSVPSRELTRNVGADTDDEFIQSNKEFWAWIYVWGRFSYLGLLDWQRNYNTKPKDLAHATECLTYKLSDLWVMWPQYRPFIRLVLSTVTRGGNQGQAIRDRILDIMHRHKLPEHHANFYEQWHQKLHNNTTPDDVAICTAIIRFLRTSGNIGEYWAVLRDHNIDRARLESYERKIVAEPYMPHVDIDALCYDLEQYLDILKDVHDSLDLKKAFAHAVRFLPHDAIAAVRCVVDYTRMSGVALKMGQCIPYTDSVDDAHRRFQSVVEARRRVIHHLALSDIKVDAARELLFLDFALEQQQVLALLGDRLSFNAGQLTEQLKDTLINLSGHDPCDEELHAITSDWIALSQRCVMQNFSTPLESALMLKALSDRMELYVGRVVNEWQSLFGPRAEYLGLEDKVFHEPTILLSGAVSGEEEIPAGVQAVLVRSAAESPDILSHVSVRARNGHVLLAVCFDPEVAKELEKYVGKWVVLDVPSDVSRLNVKEVNPPSKHVLERHESRLLTATFDRTKTQTELIDDIGLRGRKAVAAKMNLTKSSASWVVTPDEFNKESVGSKSLNLAKLRRYLPESVIIPHAVALPYGCFQKVLTHPENKDSQLVKLSACLDELKKDTPNEIAAKIFTEAQQICRSLSFPVELRKELEARIVEGLNADHILLNCYKKHGADAAWRAICEVWSSLFGLRPWVSLSRAGRSYHELNMAVLVQELLKTEYAFVLHTRNPFNPNGQNEMYGEIVVGLGEVLVGNAPGRALSWKMERNGTPTVVSFPSKAFALKGTPCLIYRSDSNGEDLEGFAGAGLFESIPAEKNIKMTIKYSAAKFVIDRDYRQNLLQKISELAFTIEDAFGAAMDVEGVVLGNDTLGVVQARPQV